MKLKALSVMSDFKDVFTKGEIYEASDMKNDLCDVFGNRLKKNGTPWTGVLSLGRIVVLGVAKFEILPKEEEDL